jgi:hypothetical protein
MIIRWFCMVLLVSLILLLPCQAVEETFKSLEYGFSIDYPKEAKVDAYDISSITGMDDPVVNIYVPDIMDIYIKALENQRTLDDFKSIILSKYEDDYNITELGSKDLELNGKKAMVVDSILENEDGDRKRIRDVLVDGGDSVYLISCRATESKFKKANQTYFGSAIMSFRTFPVNDTVEGNLPGFPIITGEKIWSSVALADINGDSKLEAIFGTNKGNLHALANDGIDIAGFPVKLSDFIRSSPAVGDLDDDGYPEVVVGCDDGMLYAFKGNGSMLKGFPKNTAGSIPSSPAIGDLDGDGKPEIIAGSRDGGIYAWHSDGSILCGFPVITDSGEIWSSPALGDLYGDGKQEIAIGSKSVCKGLVDCLAQYQLSSYNGEIYSLDGKGSSLKGFPKSLPQANDVGYSSPILVDVNQDGKMEIVCAGSHGIYVKTSDDDQEDVRGFPRKVDGICQDSFLAVGDLDKDNKPEIVAGATDGRLYVWRCDGTDMPGFPIQTGGYARQVTLGDIDGDDFQEILGGSSDNRVHAWKLNGTEAKGFPKVTLDDIETAPTLGDLENDGSLELVVGSNDGQLYAWKISEKYGELAWPMIRQNLQHTGVAAT